MNPLVTVVVPVFNGENTIVSTLQCLVSQRYENIEIIVSDNCSTDNTQYICSQYSAIDHRIKVISTGQHVSAFQNFYSLFEHGSGEYFMWAASDDSWSPDFIDRALDSFFISLNMLLALHRP